MDLFYGEMAASIEIGTKIRSTRHQEGLLTNGEALKQCFTEKLAASAERETRDSFLQTIADAIVDTALETIPSYKP